MNRMPGLQLVFAPLLHPASLAAADVEATTADGRQVILRDDGTWVLQSAPDVVMRGLTSRPAGATEVIRSKKGFVELWYDPARWTPRTRFNNESAEFALELTAGDAFAMAPVTTLRRIALDNANSMAPDARITLEEEREVNGMDEMANDFTDILNGGVVTRN